MNSLVRYQQPYYDLVPDAASPQVVRGSARATSEQAYVTIAANLDVLIDAMARVDRDRVDLVFNKRVEKFFGSALEPDASITVILSKR